MTPDEGIRIYALLAEVQREQRAGLTDLREEVQGYRADLNGRLRTLEAAEARRSGHELGRGSVGKWVLGIAAVAASIGSITAALVTVLH